MTEQAYDILEILHETWRTERKSNFSTLRRIPSSDAMVFLRRFEELDQKDASRLITIQLARVVERLLKFSPLEFCDAENRWVDQFNSERISEFQGYESYGLHLLKHIIGIALSPRMYDLRARVMINEMPEELVTRVRNVDPARATDLQHLIEPLLKERLGLTPKNTDGEEWIYSASDPETTYCVRLDFGAMDTQLSYEVLYPKMRRGFSRYESILGIPSLGWDWITEEGASDACELMVALIEQTVAISKKTSQVLKITS